MGSDDFPKNEDKSMTVEVGKIYTDRDGLDRFVISIVPPDGRKQSRVLWRRPGMFASKIENQTETAFAREVVRENNAVTADFAPDLPNGGMPDE